jgi:diguanylate cyclase
LELIGGTIAGNLWGGLLCCDRIGGALHLGQLLGARIELLIPGLISVEACLAGLVALSLIGFGILAWRDRQSRLQPAAAAAASSAKLSKTVLQLDSQAAAVLGLVRTYIDAGERYSVTLAQAGKNLPKLASPEEIAIIVKFLLAENAKMQNEAGALKQSLEQSKAQIHSLRSHLAEAQEISMRDPLTALSNRRRFDDSLKREMADARQHGNSLSLVLADIDNFKKVNDVFGHRIGDEILKMFARVLQESVCARDTVARYGGEEFAVILPETDVERAREITERMRSQLEGMQLAVNDSGREIGRITASFGIAELSLGDDPDTLVQRADATLYQAKCAGRNRVADDQVAAA